MSGLGLLKGQVGSGQVELLLIQSQVDSHVKGLDCIDAGRARWICRTGLRLLESQIKVVELVKVND